jgi:hypothetical protein
MRSIESKAGFHLLCILCSVRSEFFFVSIRSNCCNQSLSLPFDRKYVHCVLLEARQEEKEEEDEEIIKRIEDSTYVEVDVGCKRNSKKNEKSDWSVIIHSQSPNQINIIMAENE